MDEHLRNVAKLAKEFARPFGGGWRSDLHGVVDLLRRRRCAGSLSRKESVKPKKP